jgi:hypothetical protein
MIRNDEVNERTKGDAMLGTEKAITHIAAAAAFTAALIGDELIVALSNGSVGADVQSKRISLPCAANKVVKVALVNGTITLVESGGDVWTCAASDPMWTRAYNLFDVAKVTK